MARTLAGGWQDGVVSAALDYLIALLDLEEIDVNIYRGTQAETVLTRTFGGQIAAQALVAAGRTVARGRVHSLHSYFLRPGDPTRPTLFQVDRIRDGKSFTTRRVVASQQGQAIYNMQASFHDDEDSLTHQQPMPVVPAPEDLPTHEALDSSPATSAGWYRRATPIEQRYISAPPWEKNDEPRQQLWLRAAGALPDDPLLHACVITFASDMNLFDTILSSHDHHWSDEGFMGASLDHCMWFHRPVRADDWLLYDMESPIACGGRGLARGFLYTRGGQLGVSLVQEGLVRVGRP